MQIGAPTGFPAPTLTQSLQDTERHIWESEHPFPPRVKGLRLRGTWPLCQWGTQVQLGQGLGITSVLTRVQSCNCVISSELWLPVGCSCWFSQLVNLRREERGKIGAGGKFGRGWAVISLVFWQCLELSGCLINVYYG
jgi:hypothetical protein